MELFVYYFQLKNIIVVSGRDFLVTDNLLLIESDRIGGLVCHKSVFTLYILSCFPFFLQLFSHSGCHSPSYIYLLLTEYYSPEDTRLGKSSSVVSDAY